MKEAKHCYILSNGVSVVVGDRVELIATNGERYIGDIYDMTENSISCTLTDGTGEAGFFFSELEDVRLLKQPLNIGSIWKIKQQTNAKHLENIYPDAFYCKEMEELL